jgi:hypothetical protein
MVRVAVSSRAEHSAICTPIHRHPPPCAAALSRCPPAYTPLALAAGVLGDISSHGVSSLQRDECKMRSACGRMTVAVGAHQHYQERTTIFLLWGAAILSSCAFLYTFRQWNCCTRRMWIFGCTHSEHGGEPHSTVGKAAIFVVW